MKSKRADSIASTSASVTPAALISGWRSYVATFGDGISRRSSPGHGAPRPPLKKYVTGAYFSVWGTWNCRQPASENAAASERASSGGKATSTGRPASYSVIVTTNAAGGCRPAGGRPSELG